jgi:hypothetical protein
MIIGTRFCIALEEVVEGKEAITRFALATSAVQCAISLGASTTAASAAALSAAYVFWSVARGLPTTIRPREFRPVAYASLYAFSEASALAFATLTALFAVVSI